MAIKRITAANENLTSGRTREEAQRYWAEVHGKLVAKVRISSVQANRSIANVLPDWKFGDVMEGDTVFP